MTDWVSSNTSWSDLFIVKKFETHITTELRECLLPKAVLSKRHVCVGGQLIVKVMDFERDDMYIAPGICADLDNLKSVYEQLPELLTQVPSTAVHELYVRDDDEVVEKEVERIPRCLRRSVQHHLWSIVYVPQVGYLVQVLGSPLGAELLDTLDDYEQASQGHFFSMFVCALGL